ncbi:unnamed protein product [Lota lota]
MPASPRRCCSPAHSECPANGRSGAWDHRVTTAGVEYSASRLFSLLPSPSPQHWGEGVALGATEPPKGRQRKGLAVFRQPWKLKRSIGRCCSGSGDGRVEVGDTGRGPEISLQRPPCWFSLQPEVLWAS